VAQQTLYEGVEIALFSARGRGSELITYMRTGDSTRGGGGGPGEGGGEWDGRGRLGTGIKPGRGTRRPSVPRERQDAAQEGTRRRSANERSDSRARPGPGGSQGSSPGKCSTFYRLIWEAGSSRARMLPRPV